MMYYGVRGENMTTAKMMLISSEILTKKDLLLKNKMTIKQELDQFLLHQNLILFILTLSMILKLKQTQWDFINTIE